ncbi:MAG: hypothetical protein NVS9B9_26900 [Ktedonobacteraceae bacterium]
MKKLLLQWQKRLFNLGSLVANGEFVPEEHEYTQAIVINVAA